MVKFIILERKLSRQTGKPVSISLSDRCKNAQIAVYPFYALRYRGFHYLEWYLYVHQIEANLETINTLRDLTNSRDVRMCRPAILSQHQ
jgi:hypothetical protein